MNHRLTKTILLFSLSIAISTSCSSQTKDLRSDELFIMKRSKLKGSYALKVGDLLMNDSLFIWKSFDLVKVNGSNIDWSMNPFNNSSWLNYFHSLEMVSYLCNAFEVSQNVKYLEKAKMISSQWLNKFPVNKEFDRIKYSKYPWYDHSVANRTINLTYLNELYLRYLNTDVAFLSFLQKRIEEHAEWLAESQNYVEYNHGIMQDRALLQVAVLYDFKDSEKWLSIALDRLEVRYVEDVSINGVHFENSPGYHPLAMLLLKDILDFLAHYNKNVSGKLPSIYNKMVAYQVFLTKPDMRLPMIGDTGGSTFTPNAYLDYSPHIEYISTKGQKGESPEQVSMVYPNAGVAIFRDKWHDSTDYENTSYIYFVSGFIKSTHKHPDNLSFIWYAAGEDLLIDPGSYSYQKSEMQEYLRKSYAHNSITINGESYSTRAENVGSSHILKYKTEKDFDYIAGINTAYSNIVVYRELLFIKPNAVVILDKILSDTIVSAQQIFNLSKNAKNIFNSYKGISVNFENSLLEIKQYVPFDSVTTFFGAKNPLRGYASYQANKTIPIYQIEFSKTSFKNVNFISSLSIETSVFENPVKIDSIVTKVNKNIIYYSDKYGQKSYSLEHLITDK